MRKNYLQSGLKILVLAGLMSMAVFAQNGRSNDLDSKHWELTELSGRRINNSKAYLEFDAQSDRFSGNAGCNRMSGSVRVNGSTINFGSVITTKMFCADDKAMKIETELTRALGRATRFQIAGNTLKIYERRRLILKFRGTKKAISSDNSGLKLEDRKWLLESIKGVNLPKIEFAPFINFDKSKSSAGGNSGCNSFGGNYTSDGATIKIFSLVSTMRACIEDERMNVESGFNEGLQNANRFEITGDRLKLYQDENLLLTFRGVSK